MDRRHETEHARAGPAKVEDIGNKDLLLPCFPFWRSDVTWSGKHTSGWQLMGIGSKAEVTLHGENEAKDLMRRFGWLSRTPEEFKATVLHRCRLLNFRAGDPIYRVGDPAGGLYGLVSGGVALSVAPQERGPYFAHVMTPGSWYGLQGAVSGQHRELGLIAARQSQLLILPLAEFNRIVTEDPGAWRYFAVLALLNSTIAIRAADDLLIRNPVRRCVATLLRLSGLRQGSQDIVLPLNVDVTQEELAHLSNLSRNATGSVLRSMAKRGLVELAYKYIRIIDPDALRAIIQEDDQH